MAQWIIAGGDLFIWVTSILGGIVVLSGMFAGLRSYLASPRDSSLLGDWYTYGYFQGTSGPVFYKEKGRISRHPVLPWIFQVKTHPDDGDGSTIYRGTLSYHAPYLYFTAFEPIYHDRTFEIYCRRMNDVSESKFLIGIHLGRSYDEGIHTACAVLMSRTELDPLATAQRRPDLRLEEEEFRRIVKPFFAVDQDSLQLLMFQGAQR